MKGRLIRVALGTLGALALIQAIRVWEAAGRDVQLIYRLTRPTRALTVRLYDAQGASLRRVYFAAAPFRHALTLPDGDYHADCGGGAVGRFSVRADGPIEVDCHFSRPQ
ncbi:hypothetical protein KKF91_02420 [Myxococcota bacterium]|nr:hypothetical protein [Myxococcota bacterium]MBU1896888.1 hypothetical protein [Myxococcota bacterium]